MKEVIQCKICGNSIRPLSRNHIYCSDVCRNKGRNILHKVYNNKEYKTKYILVDKDKIYKLIERLNNNDSYDKTPTNKAIAKLLTDLLDNKLEGEK